MTPKLIYGTAWKAERTAELVERAVLAGFRGIDTACQPKHYNEAGVGQALASLERKGIPRDALFLQTKFTSLDGQDPSRVPYDPSAPLASQVAQSFAASLKNLGTDRLDSWVLHAPMRTFDETLTVWEAMEKVHRAGGAKALGISNCYELDSLKALYESAAVKPSVVQNRFYAKTGYDVGLRAWCGDNGLTYQSFWTLTANPHILSHPVLQTIARDRRKTPEQILLRFLTQQGVVPLTGTTSERHMKEDLEALDFGLSAADLGALLPLFESVI
ncbi:MAG: aldo/keto reductase [Elusimicrobia bacterium]|nr:aldo/keto reductase [Elusimicrobiota bacterium]